MIVATRSGRDLEVATRTANLAGLGIENPWQGGSSAGVSVTPTSVTGIPAFNRAVQILSAGVASLRMRVWRGDTPMTRTSVTNVWQARLLRGAVSELQTRFVFWETVQTSLSVRGNAYIWKNVDRATGRAVELVALHPDQVLPVLTFKGIEYHVLVGQGFVDPTGKGPGFYTVDENTILHIRGQGGALVAPSPVQIYQDSLGVSIARLRHEARTYNRGASMRLLVTMPGGVGIEQAKEWRQFWRDTYEGPDATTTGILGGGATAQPISMSMGDAQFIESQNFGVAECARIVGVPASILDNTGARGNSTPLSPEHERTRLLSYGLSPCLERIESAFEADDDLFGATAAVYPAFDTETFIRGDLTTEDAIAHQQIQDGRLLVDEWRVPRGLDPLPDGLGKIPQVIPVGGGANPVPAPTVTPPAPIAPLSAD